MGPSQVGRYTICVLLLALASATALRAQPANADAQQLSEFKKRVDLYAGLRANAEKGAAKLSQSEEPARIKAAQEALAAKIRVARTNAAVGDVFTTESRPLFRRLLRPPLKGADGAENKAAIEEDNPGAIPLKPNAPYPEKEPLSTVPPDVLKALPVLPEDIEYRFVGKHLILFDARANLIVDFIPNAIP